VAFFAASMRSFFKGIEFFIDARLGIMAGFAFFNCLTIFVSYLLSIFRFSMMTGSTTKIFLMLLMGKEGKLCFFAGSAVDFKTISVGLLSAATPMATRNVTVKTKTQKSDTIFP
jgi:hypothetical protein